MDTKDFLDYGIALEGTSEFVPKDIASKIIERMKQLIDSRSDAVLGKLMGCAPAVVYQISKGKCRLNKSHIELFLKKRPGITASDLLKNIIPTEHLILTAPSASENKGSGEEQPEPADAINEEKFKLPTSFRRNNKRRLIDGKHQS
ncbi:MAG: hypothetical protein ACD_11C00127G0002 [uncultured bacterium]|nr:MAG: hypothetical protein ACD_11C00127G0002 [uncultured bacterium]